MAATVVAPPTARPSGADEAAEEAADEIAWAHWNSDGWRRAADAAVLAAQRAGCTIRQISDAADLGLATVHAMSARALKAEPEAPPPPMNRQRKYWRPGVDVAPVDEPPATPRQEAALRLFAGRRQLSEWLLEGRDVRRSGAYDRVMRAAQLYTQFGGDPNDPARLRADCEASPLLARQAADKEEWEFW